MKDERILPALSMVEDSNLSLPADYIPDEGFTFRMSQAVCFPLPPRTASFDGSCSVCHAEMHQQWIGDPPYKWRCCDCGAWYTFNSYM